jgi:hypothetical protein
MATLTNEVRGEAECFSSLPGVIQLDHATWESVEPVSNRYECSHQTSVQCSGELGL